MAYFQVWIKIAVVYFVGTRRLLAATRAVPVTRALPWKMPHAEDDGLELQVPLLDPQSDAARPPPHARCGGHIKYLREVVEVCLLVVAAIALHQIVHEQSKLSDMDHKMGDMDHKMYTLDAKMNGFDQQIAEVKRDAAQAHEDVANVSTAIEQFAQSQRHFLHEMNTMNASETKTKTLFSGSYDKTIKVWRVLREGRSV